MLMSMIRRVIGFVSHSAAKVASIFHGTGRECHETLPFALAEVMGDEQIKRMKDEG